LFDFALKFQRGEIMQTGVAETIYEKAKVLPPDKQQEIFHQIEILEQKTEPTIW